MADEKDDDPAATAGRGFAGDDEEAGGGGGGARRGSRDSNSDDEDEEDDGDDEEGAEINSYADDDDDDDASRGDDDEEEGEGEEGEIEEITQREKRELSELLGALAVGVRAVQGLPVDSGDDGNFQFERSFPEFSSGVDRARSCLVETLVGALRAAAASTSSTTAGSTSSSSLGWLESNAIEDLLVYGGDESSSRSFEDPDLWEKCADACDALMDRVDASIELLQQQQRQGGGDHFQQQQQQQASSLLHKLSNQARDRGRNSYQVMIDGIVDMDKPQNKFTTSSAVAAFGASSRGDGVNNVPPIQNSRVEPFIPPVGYVGDEKPHGMTPLRLDMVQGHGLESRYGALRGGGFASGNKKILPPNLVAPPSHVPHLYKDEIERFEYMPSQLRVVSPPSKDTVEASREAEVATWVDAEEALKFLSNEMEKSATEIAIDLEAHSHRSFAGLTCLMQITFRTQGDKEEEAVADGSRKTSRNYLIDTLALRGFLGRYLQPCFANPEIVKVMHGADSDMGWLQRDFGLYVVNLFDTGRAARALEFPSAGLAYLLRKYVGIDADKSFQLADWRQRSLPDKMRRYAVQDTCYLLDIYDRLRWDLVRKGGEVMIKQVFDVSRQVCLIRYAVEPFNPDGYKVLLRSRGKGSVITSVNDLQTNVLKGLYDWRDRTARVEDESLQYVCSNRALVRIAMAAQSTTSLRALQSLLNPVPPLLLDRAQEVIDIIKSEIRKNAKDEAVTRREDMTGAAALSGATKHKQAVGAPSSAFFKPSKAKSEDTRSGMMSPVLGTEALYQQAGWTTPPSVRKSILREAESSATTSTGEEDEDDPTTSDQKPKRLLSVHASNKNWQAASDGGGNGGRQQEESDDAAKQGTVDGMGTALAAREHTQPFSAVEAEAQRARQSAMQIRMSQKSALPAVLGLVTPTIDIIDDDDALEDSNFRLDGASLGSGKVQGDASAATAAIKSMDDAELSIPRSMKEIFQISNRNRRLKKTGSPTPERGVTPTSEKEREELAQAEAILRDRGMLASPYFDDGSPEKRQRTKPLSGRDSEESVPHESTYSSTSRDEDLVQPGAAAAETRRSDLAVIQAVGWIQPGAVSADLTSGSGGAGYPGSTGRNSAATEANKDGVTYGFDYSSAGGIGALDPAAQPSQNPFFSGAALAGGQSSTTQGFAKSDQQRSKGKGNYRSRQNRSRQERPEKKEGKSHAYRKR